MSSSQSVFCIVIYKGLGGHCHLRRVLSDCRNPNWVCYHGRRPDESLCQQQHCIPPLVVGLYSKICLASFACRLINRRAFFIRLSPDKLQSFPLMPTNEVHLECLINQFLECQSWRAPYLLQHSCYTSWPAAETSQITFHGFHLGPYAENTSKMKHHEGWCGECACCKAHAHDVVGKAQIQLQFMRSFLMSISSLSLFLGFLEKQQKQSCP